MLLRKDEQMDLGTNLKQLRKERNLKQEDLAECLSVSPQTVSKWENNLPSMYTSRERVLAKISEGSNLIYKFTAFFDTMVLCKSFETFEV